MDTKADEKQIRRVSLQKKPDRIDRPIGYESSCVDEPWPPYETIHVECLAVILAVILLQTYLEDSRFTMWTDQNALKLILNLNYSIGKLRRWRLRLSEFWFDFIYCAAITYQAADNLSPVKATGNDQTPINDEIPVLWITASSSSEKEEVSDAYMHEYDVWND